MRSPEKEAVGECVCVLKQSMCPVFFFFCSVFHNVLNS